MMHDNTERLAATAADRLTTASHIADAETRRDRLAMAHAAVTDAVIEAASCAAVAVDRREMADDLRRIIAVVVEAGLRYESWSVRHCLRAGGGPAVVDAAVLRLLGLLDEAGADGSLPGAEYAPKAEPLPTLATDAPCAMDGLDYPDGAA